jgi:hypothetical protein
MVEVRFYPCKNCGTEFRAMPPDDLHMVAMLEQCKKKDSINIPYECKNCHELNVIHWDVKHERFEDDFNRINVASD